MSVARPDPAPLFRLKGLPVAFAVAVVLCWPMYLSGEIFVFSDSGGYLRAGREIWRIVGDALQSVLAAPTQDAVSGANPGIAGAITEADGGPKFARSILYATLAYGVWAIASPLWIALLQGTAVIFALFALLDRAALASPRVLLPGGVLVAALTTLPWHTVYLMPDILGVIPLIFGAVLLSGFDRLGPGQKTTLTLMTALAGAAHYGNMPLIGGICIVCGAVLLVTRRLTWVVLLSMAVAVSFAPALNMVASRATLETSSVSPLRLPILLARSLRDGPARWYLETRCGTASFAMCDAFGGRIPGTLNAFLWADDGIRSLSPEVMAQIRAEEAPLLWQVFLTYPVAQTASLLGNTGKQLLRAGTGQVWASAGFDNRFEAPISEDGAGFAMLRRFDRITPCATLLSALMLAALAVSGRLSAQQGRILAALAVGILGNAFIFGGLSAPVDRYQSRLIWILPAILVIFAAQVDARRRQSRNRNNDQKADAPGSVRADVP